jgi:hypothetical protein
MSYRPLALTGVVAALSIMHIESVWRSPFMSRLAAPSLDGAGAGPVYVTPAHRSREQPRTCSLATDIVQPRKWTAIGLCGAAATTVVGITVWAGRAMRR